jgi:hypothetical protein
MEKTISVMPVIGILLLLLFLKKNKMLKISLDEAYVFDLLSIYSVKIENSFDSKKIKLLKSYKLLSSEIINQIGQKLFDEILVSDEYKNLISSNQNVFNLVGKSNESELSKITADANYDRYTKKIILQNKFFKDTLTEIKI